MTEYKVKVGDFGFATEIQSADEKLTDYCGTPSYAAPEERKQKPIYKYEILGTRDSPII